MLISRSCLWAGLLAIALYLVTVVVLGLLTPQYSHITNLVSDLGRQESPYHMAFSISLGMVGALFVLSSVGFFDAVRTISGNLILSIAIGVAIAAIGVGIIISAIFPLPDPRHGGFGLARLFFLVPLLIAIAIWKKPYLSSFKVFNLGSFVALLTSIPIFRFFIENEQMGLGQRITVLIMFGWFTITSYYFLRFADEKHQVSASPSGNDVLANE